MNQGSFLKHCELLLIHIFNIQRTGKLKQCLATTKYLAKSIGRSTRQTDRYLKELENRNLIVRHTTPLLQDKNKKLYKLRTIETTKISHHPQQNQVFALYFDKRVHTRTKNRLIRDFIKSPKFKLTNILNSNTIAQSINKAKEIISNLMDKPKLKPDYSDLKIPLDDPYQEHKRIKILEYLDLGMNRTEAEIVAQSDMDEEESRFNQEKEERIGKWLLRIYEEGDVLVGRTNREKYINLTTLKNRQSFDDGIYDSCPPEEKKELAEIWAQNSEFKDGEYYIKQFFPDGSCFEVKFFNYFPFDEKSEYFKLFKQEFDNLL